MRKLIAALGLLILGATSAMAQIGQTAIGVDLGVAPSVQSGSSVTNLQLDGKVQVFVTNDLRVEGKIGYGFRDQNVGVFTMVVDGQYVIPITNKVKMYPLAGVGYARPSGKHWSSNKFLFDVGLGGEFAITRSLAAQLEVRYEYIKHFQRMPITIGLAYKF